MTEVEIKENLKKYKLIGWILTSLMGIIYFGIMICDASELSKITKIILSILMVAPIFPIFFVSEKIDFYREKLNNISIDINK